MKSASCLLWAFLLMLAPLTALSQSREGDTLPDDFWTRFEVRFDRFMKTLFDDFSPDDSSLAAKEAGSSPVHIISSDTTIQVGDTLRGSVLVDHAALTLEGVLDGDLIARSAAIALHGSACITGDVRLVESSIERDDEARVLGALEQTRSRWIDAYEDGWPVFRPFRRPLPWTDESWTASPFFVRYNRVEGLFLGLGSAKKYYWNGERDFGAFGSVGYGFLSHRWRGNLGITRQFAFAAPSSRWLLEIGLEGYSLTDTRDPWIIGQAENTAAAFFLREDYRDYFQREGFAPHIALYHRTSDVVAEAKVAFHADRYANIDNNASWALFGGKRVFRQNPAIVEGRMRSVVADVGVSSVWRDSKVPHGWTAYAMAEFSDPGVMGGEFDFQKYVIDVRRYQPVGKYDRFNARLRAGTSHGVLPGQKTYQLGGLGTVPAFGFASMPGDSIGANRMLLMNAEYLVSGDILHDLSFWPSGLLRHINFVLLADAGFSRTVSSSVSPLSGFEGIHWSDFRSDVGIGLANVSGSVRAALVWRTDRSEPARFIVRLSRPF